MIKSLDPVARLREIAKVDPRVRVFIDDHYVPYAELLQKLFNQYGYTMVVRLTNDVESTPAE